MSQKIYLKILQWGVFLSFLGFFLVNNDWLYPYSTPKQIFFNILMEVLAVFWLAAIVKYPALRPKKSWLTIGLAAWLAITLITCFTGADFNLSFWGDANRMLGWFHLAHFFIFYLILITAFRERRDWQKLFDLSLITAVLLVVYSLIKTPESVTDPNSTVNTSNNISSLGNATHVAGVMMMSFFIALFSLWRARATYAKWLYAAAGLIILAGFFYADVSGSQAGLAVGLVLFGLLYAFLAGGKKTRRRTLIGVGAFVTVVAILYGWRQQPFMANRFGKLFRDFSLQNTNLNTRLYAWRAGWQGFLAKPILGWGYGNFSLVYDKFFDGGYYRYTMQEEYFDRSHNNLIDWASTTGVVGLAAYLLIFAAWGYYLIKGYRQKKFSWLVLATAASAMTAYFIHNLAVFDFWGNYFLWFMLLAGVWILFDKRELENKATVGQVKNAEIGVWLGAGIAAVFLIVHYNLAFAQSFRDTIRLTDLLREAPAGQDLLAMSGKTFQKSAAMDRSGIDAVSDYVTGHTETIDNVSRADQKQFFDYLIALNKKVVAFNPNNSLSQARLVRTLMTACLNLEDKSYCQQSFDPTAKSLATGGQHIPVYRMKSTVQLYLGDTDGSIDTLQQALKIYDQYTEVNCQLARIYIKLRTATPEDRAAGADYMKKCVAEGGGKDFVQGNDQTLSSAYKQAQETIKTEVADQNANAKTKQYIDLLDQALRLKGQGDQGNRDAYYRAIDLWKQAAALTDNKVWIPLVNIGNTYKILGDFTQAEDNYNRALSLAKDSTIYLQKIDLYQVYMKKPPEETRRLYQEALTVVVVDNGNLMIGYAAFCRDNGYLEDALQAYQSLSKSFPDQAVFRDEISKLQAKLKR